MTASTCSALTGLILLAVCHAHPQYPAVYYSNGQPYGGGYYNPQQAGPGRGNGVQRYAGPLPVQPQHPGQYVYVAPAGYPGIPPQQAPILFRQEPAVGESPDAPPPAQPGVWMMFIQWIGIRPTEAPPPVVAPAEETPETMPGAAAAAEDTTQPSGQKAPEKPEKVMLASNEQALNEKETANLESLDETIPEDDGESPSVEDGDDSKSTDPEVVETPNYMPARPVAVRPVPVGPMAGYPNRRYVPLQPPQFYGNFDVLQQGYLPQGPVHDARDSNVVYLRNQPQPQYPQLQYPYQPQPFPVVPPRSRDQVAPQAYRPGAAALVFQNTLQAGKQEQLQSKGGHSVVEGRGAFIPGSKHVDISQFVQKQLSHQEQKDIHEAAHFPGETELLGGQPGLTSDKDVQTFNRDGAGSQPGLINVGPGYQNLYFFSTRGGAEDNQAVAVEAPKLKKEEIVADAENVTAAVEEQAGPSVAQAKPQAIAVAGPGGVAAAQPIATAIVGPGGLAVAAPTATAVAGQTGGGALIAPAMAAVNKQRTMGRPAKDDDDYSQSVVAYGV